VLKRAWLGGVVAVAGSLAMAGSASAAYSCSYDAVTDTLDVSLTGFEEVAAIRRDGSDIEITNDVMGGELSCAGGTPTINNTETIELVGPGAVAPAVYFDLKKGPMSPGTTSESPELSEIEIDVDWPDGFFGLGGGNNDDRYTFGLSVLGPAVMLNNDPDADAFLGTTQTILLRGEKGNDKLSGKGGPGFLAPIDIFMTIEGGPGDDKVIGGARRDILYGEGGEDRVKGGDGKDIIDVKDGAKDKVKCGAGKDEVVGDSIDRIAGDCEKVDS
jgi:RTX calcium-binding nonapeptide repeat (4 copies)